MNLTKQKLSEASVPSNIAQFAKRRGVMPLVNKVAKWATVSGKRIVGGTAIGKGYSTLVLDLTHNGSEVYIDLDDETISVNGQDVSDLKSFKRALELKESKIMKLTKSQLREIIREQIKTINENEIKVGSKVIVNYPTLKKPIMGIVKMILKGPDGPLYILKNGEGVWDEKWVQLKN
jgi:hypothetical protein